MLSQSQANFFIMRPIFIDHPQMKEVFKNNSYEILQFLTSDDIQNLKLTNHFFLDICDCHELLGQSMKSLSELFSRTINISVKDDKPKKSKFKEKFNFNKPIGEYYKPSKEYMKRIESATKRKQNQNKDKTMETDYSNTLDSLN